MLKRILPSIDPGGTPNGLEHGLLMILSIFTECILLSCIILSPFLLCLVEQVYVITNHYFHYHRLWRDREGQVRKLHFLP